MSVRVAIVATDPDVRMSAARAFDGAPPDWEIELHDRAPASADVIVASEGHEAPGAIVFDPDDPDRALAEVGARLRSRGRVACVTSPSGGTGATTVALHLAGASAGSASTCFVDLDAQWGAAPRVGLGLDPPRTWADATRSPEQLMAAAVPLPAGFRALFAPRDADTSLIPALLDGCRSTFDRVVVDAPRLALASVLPYADAVLVVIQPAPQGALRAAAFVDTLGDVCRGLIANRLGPGGETSIRALETALGMSIALELPCSRALRDAEDDGRLLTSPLSPWTWRMRRLARALDEL